MADLTGQVIDHYRIDALIGDGGMGTVYRAYDLNLERTVALKLMHDHFSRQDEFRARLAQEARTIAQLDHPSIVKIFDFGQHEDGLYIAMEYLADGNLRNHLQLLQGRGKFLPVQQSLQIALQIADALDYAHGRGVIHRDVKPSNIILKRLTRPDEDAEQPFRAVLTDFGLVKLLEGEELTRSGTTWGTPAYMSPEQCEGLELDGRSDLYSLGVVLYELLTNRPPFAFKTLSEAMATHMKGAMPMPARDLRPELPALLDGLLGRALAKLPADRFASGAEMAEAIRAAQVALADAPTQVFDRPAEAADEAARVESLLARNYRLRIETPGHPPSYARLGRPLVSVGRSAENDIVLPAEGVSRFHTRIQAGVDGWRAIDLGGPNGTWLNGERLVAREPGAMRAGAVLEIGPYRLVLEREPAELPSGAGIAAAETAALAAAGAPETAYESDDRTAAHVAEAAPLDLYLTRESLSVEPGRQAELNVEIVNRSNVEDRVSLRVEGLPAGWATVPDRFMRLAAGQSVTIPVVIRPPRVGDTPSGRQRFRVVLISQRFPDLQIGEVATLDLGPFEILEVALEPRQVTLPGSVEVSVRNLGNRPAEFSVVGRDPEGAIQFQGERGRVALAPSQAAVIELQMEPRRRSWFGGLESFGFEVEVASRAGGRHVVDGQARAAALLPMGVVYGAIFLGVFLCALVTFVLVFQRDRFGDGTAAAALAAAQTATAEAAVETVVFGTQTVEAVTAAAATAAVLGDRDKDGLSDSQEAMVGTNPDVPDTDGDGLLDGEEVLTWATNPLNRDTDSDVLADGDEVRVYKTNPVKRDTDGDGLPDGVEISLGTDPLNPLDPPPTAAPLTPSATPTAGPTATPSQTPSITPTSPPSATPTFTTTPLPTATATATATPSVTPSPSVTVSPSPPGTVAPALALACAPATPTLDGTIQVTEWGTLPFAVFAPGGDLARQVSVYVVRDELDLYLALVINDPTADPDSDRVEIYFDANGNAGDPDAADRYFVINRNGTLAVRAGIGTNADNNDWDMTYESSEWTAVTAEPGGNRWLFEMRIEAAAEMPLVSGGGNFATMFLASYNSAPQSVWPELAVANDLGTWAPVDNTTCP